MISKVSFAEDATEICKKAYFVNSFGAKLSLLIFIVDEKIYFSSSDVANILGINEKYILSRRKYPINSGYLYYVLSVLNKDAASLYKKYDTNLPLFNESDLYRVLFTCGSEKAEDFEQWLTEGLLVLLRNDTFSAVETQVVQEPAAQNFEALSKTVLDLEKRCTALENSVEKFVSKLESLLAEMERE